MKYLYFLTVATFLACSGYIGYSYWQDQQEINRFSGAHYTQQLWLHPKNAVVKEISYGITYEGVFKEVYDDGGAGILLTSELRNPDFPFSDPVSIDTLVKMPDGYENQFVEVNTLTTEVVEGEQIDFNTRTINILDAIGIMKPGDYVFIELDTDLDGKESIKYMALTNYQ